MSLVGLWECAEEEREYQSTHAELTYDDVAEAGSPSRPLDFPAPTVSRCSHVDLRARDHRSGTVHWLRNVIMRSGVDTSGNRSNIAYLIKKKMAKTTYGSIRLCIVLKRISRSKVDLREDREDRQDRQDAFDPEFVEWESTDTLVVIKISEWYKIHSMRGRLLEDPIKEIGALQLLGSYHPHVQGARDALQDDDNLYAVMPYLPGGDLYGRLVEHDLPIEQNEGNVFHGFAESRARVWIRHLLQVRSDGSIIVTSIG
jgi:serine/threonine protein kinase